MKSWDDRYNDNECILFYPQESLVRFLNSFIRKRVDFNNFKDILKSANVGGGGGLEA